jgi:hypothetical protein
LQELANQTLGSATPAGLCFKGDRNKHGIPRAVATARPLVILSHRHDLDRKLHGRKDDAVENNHHRRSDPADVGPKDQMPDPGDVPPDQPAVKIADTPKPTNTLRM